MGTRPESRRTARRVPAVTQVAQTECGLCCCVAVLRYYGRDEGISEVREDMDAGRDGLSARQLARFLESRGMRSRLLSARSVAALTRFDSPVILFWDDHHFVVLESFDGDQAVVMDPSVGRRRVTSDELAQHFSGVVVTAEPGPAFRRLRRRPFADWRTMPLLPEGAGRRMAGVGALSLAAYAAVLGIPLLTEWSVDRFSGWTELGDHLWVIGMVVGAAAGYYLLHLLRILLLSSLVSVLGRHLMDHAFTRLLSLPYRFFTTRQPGELLFRLGSVNAVRDMLSSRVAQGVLDIGTLACVTGYLMYAEWRLGLMALALVLANAGYLAATRSRVLEAVDMEITHLGRSQSLQLDAIVSIPTIKMGGYADEYLDTWRETYAASLEAMKARMRLQQGRVSGVAATIQMFGPLLLLLASLYFVGQGTITIGGAIAVQTVAATYFAISTSVFQAYAEFTETSRYMSRLSDITRAEPEGPGGERKELAAASVRLDQVSFRYTRHSEPVVREVTMDIPAGARVALVGASGSGKSTLARIVCGLHEPTSGSVLFGGRDAAEYDRDSLRRVIGYIPQEVHLHNRSILENLTLGQDIPEETVREFCREAGILDFLDDLPMGLHTLVAEMGSNFSGGQRQRLAIVRTLLQRPSILVMDEATASLDTVNERRVTRLIEGIGATQIVIAHRLSTIESADLIYVFDQGRIVEQGTHSELMDGGSVYRDLYAATADGAGPTAELLVGGAGA
ncbi:peptidase domain-containing ABC transporter [Streptomyces exfoliatus]|uniref:peptidase domain-containing ABC transporter n=1 Tax=Streptomyces exfoliatus TaxID=1905 RepID=UPI00378A8238